MGYEDKVGEMGEYVEREWESSCMPALVEYLKVPNQSPNYDAEERKNGLTEKAMGVLVEWVRGVGVEGMEVELMEEEGRTPFLLCDIAARGGEDKVKEQKTVLMYGHMDKQPPMDDQAPGWSEGLGPYTPVVRDGKLYGRGGADDGYAVFAALTAVRALQRSGLGHGHVVVLIEGCEESGSMDLPHWIERSRGRIGEVDLVVCLDSGTLDYETMYVTQSLRGVCGGRLTVSLLREGMHSGLGGGVVADSFRVARRLLSRVEDEETGEVLVPECGCPVPPEVVEGFQYLDEEVAKKRISSTVPFLEGVEGEARKESELALLNSWKPCVTVVGCDGMPSCAEAGNVLRRETSLQLSIRLPPLVDPDAANMAVKRVLMANPPLNARVTYEPEFSGPGWAAPPLRPWCHRLVDAASRAGYGRPFAKMACGGSIPFMGMLGEMFPAAQFCITGVLGPQSNAHGPNEFLHIDYTKKLVVALTRVVWGHAHDSRHE